MSYKLCGIYENYYNRWNQLTDDVDLISYTTCSYWYYKVDSQLEDVIYEVLIDQGGYHFHLLDKEVMVINPNKKELADFIIWYGSHIS